MSEQVRIWSACWSDLLFRSWPQQTELTPLLKPLISTGKLLKWFKKVKSWNCSAWNINLFGSDLSCHWGLPGYSDRRWAHSPGWCHKRSQCRLGFPRRWKRLDSSTVSCSSTFLRCPSIKTYCAMFEIPALIINHSPCSQIGQNHF